MKAVLSATATSSVGTIRPRWARRPRSPAASACAMERMVSPASRPERSESSGTKAPSTNTTRRASIAGSMASASLASAFAAGSGTAARGFASRMSARKSVYFHSSTRRCGKPSVSKRRKASSRSAPTAPAPGSAPLTAAKLCAIAVSRHLFLVLGIAGGFEIERQLLVPGLHDAAAREHVHHVGHDVVEQALVVRDHHEGALGRAQPIDAVRDDLERVDVEPGIGLVEHAQPRLQQRHLQDFVALLLAAGEADINPAAQHLLLDAELARHRAHALEKFGRGKLVVASLLALRVERGAKERHGGDAGNFKRILEGEEKTLGGALLGWKGENVLAVEQHLPLRHDVVVLAGEHVRQRRLARAVRPHQPVHAAPADRKLEPVENF